jgi:hypothetical protein
MRPSAMAWLTINRSLALIIALADISRFDGE